MVDAGFVDAATAEAAIAQPIRVESASLDTSDAPYFVDLVQQQLSERYDARDLATQNLAVYTSLDLSLQALAQQVLTEGLARVDKMIRRKDHPPVQGALIALEPGTGAVLALVGGRDYSQSQYNRATTAKRQPGSTFKPFVYLTAFEATFDDPALPPITPATVVEDAPTVFLWGRQEYAPQNYENDYKGYVTLRTALAHSLNNATVKVAEMVGYERIGGGWGNTPRESPSQSGVWGTSDGGLNWTPLNNGLTNLDGTTSSVINGLWLGRKQCGLLRPRCHQCRPGRQRVDDRQVPQRGADVATRHRPRLPPRYPGEADPARARAIWT